jgi:hypothetical protein
VAVVLVMLWLVARRSGSEASGFDGFMGILAVSSTTYLAWYLFLFTGGWTDRYILHPMLAFLCLLVCLAARTFPRTGLPVLLLAAALVAPAARTATTRAILLFRPVPWLDGRSTFYNDQVLEVTTVLTERTFRFPLANCGWLGTTRAIEFLLPAINNFKDCYRLIEEAIEPLERPRGGAIGTNAVGYRWRHPVSFTLVINKVNWMLSETYPPNKVRHDVLALACGSEPLYENELFRIAECDFAGLERHVPLDASMPFVHTPPMWMRHVAG